MAISFADNINIRGPKPNVERDLHQTIAAMRAYDERYLPPLFIAMCVEDGQIYTYNKNNEPDPITGKWRAFRGGNGTGLTDEDKAKIDLIGDPINFSIPDVSSIIAGLNVLFSSTVTNITLTDTTLTFKNKGDSIVKTIDLSPIIPNTNKALNELTDTVITDVENNQIIYFDGVAKKWKNKTETFVATANAYTDSKVGDLSTVNIGAVTTVVAALNALNLASVHSMEFNNADNKLYLKNSKNENLSSVDLSDLNQEFSLEDLKNISIANVADKHIIAYDGVSQKWINKEDTTLATAKAYTDEKIGNLNINQGVIVAAKPTAQNAVIGDWYYWQDSNEDWWQTRYLKNPSDETVEMTMLVGSMDLSDYVSFTLNVASAYEETPTDTSKIPDIAWIEGLKAALVAKISEKIATSDIVDNLTSTDTDKPLSANQGKVLKDEVDSKIAKADIAADLITDINTKVLAASQGKALKDEVDNKVNTSDIVDNLISTDTDKPLSANQGKVLNDKFDSYLKTENIVDNLTSTSTDKPLSANQGKILAKMIADGAGNGGGGGVFTETSGTGVAVGGLAKGAIITNLTDHAVLKKILFPYVKPSISLSLSPSALLYKKGTIINSIALTAVAAKNSNDITRIMISIGGTTLKDVNTDIANGATVTHTYDTPVSTDTTFTASVTDGTNSSTDSKKIEFIDPMYYGIDGNELTEVLQKKGTFTYNNITCTNGKVVFKYPASYGYLTSILDASSFECIGSFSTSIVEIDGIDYVEYKLTIGATLNNFKYVFKF